MWFVVRDCSSCLLREIGPGAGGRRTGGGFVSSTTSLCRGAGYRMCACTVPGETGTENARLGRQAAGAGRGAGGGGGVKDVGVFKFSAAAAPLSVSCLGQGTQ